MARLITASGVTVNVADEKVEARIAGGGYRVPTEATADGTPKGNASRDEWASYADSLGVQYDAEAKRDDIKAAVEAHNA